MSGPLARSIGSRRARWVVIAVAAAVVVGGGVYTFGQGDDDRPTYRFATVERGPIARIVSASGTLRAVVTVEVGSQVSGQIKEMLADYNTEVKAGQVIARLDPATFETLVQQAKAERAVARANVSMQRAALGELKADVEGARATLAEARLDLKRKRALLDRRVVSKSQVDKAVAVNDQTRAMLKAATAKLQRQKAQIEHALAQVRQREAALRHRQLDLEHSIIRSPVDGVVISRNVDIGQTVAASFSGTGPVHHRTGPQPNAGRGERRRSRHRAHQTGTAYQVHGRHLPESRVHGARRSDQIRKAPTEVSNVVTYTVVVSAANPDHSLLPGMTANVSVIVAERAKVLKVANAALRFRAVNAGTSTGANGAGPPRGPAAARARTARAIERLTKQLELKDDQQAELRAVFREAGQKIRALRQQGASGPEIRAFARAVRVRNRPRIVAFLDAAQREKFRTLIAARGSQPVRRGRLWVLGDDGDPRPIDVAYGISDGTVSEIVRGNIEPGARVIIGVARRTSSNSRTRPRFGL